MESLGAIAMKINIATKTNFRLMLFRFVFFLHRIYKCGDRSRLAMFVVIYVWKRGRELLLSLIYCQQFQV